MAILVAIALFAYAIIRINSLEKKINELSQGKIKKEVVAQQKPVEQKPSLPSSYSQEVVVDKPQETSISHKKVSEKNLEFKVGGKVFTLVGIIALLVGISLFLKYAFDNDIIGEPLRVGMGIFAGLILLVVGKFTRKKYAGYSNVITGGGLGLLYLSVYASFNFYNLISPPVAFLGMIAVTVIGIVLALYYNTVSLMYVSQLGGFLTPVLMRGASENPHAFLGYLLLLNIGLIVIAKWKSWKALIFLSVIGTAVTYLDWFYYTYNDSVFTQAILYTSMIFLTYLVVTIINQLKSEGRPKEIDLAILFSVPALYYLANIFTIDALHPDMTSFFTLGLAVLYLILGVTVVPPTQQVTSRIKTNPLFLAISFVFFAIAIPQALDGHAVAIAWGALALAILLLGIFVNSKSARLFSYGTYALSVGHLFIHDLEVSTNAQAWLNYRNLSILLLFIFFSTGSYLYHFFKNNPQSQDNHYIKEMGYGASTLAATAYFLLFLGFTAEIMDFHPERWLIVIWSTILIAGALMAYQFRLPILLRLGYPVMAAITIFLVSEYNNMSLAVASNEYRVLFNERVLMSLIAVIAFAVFLKLSSTDRVNITTIEKKLVGMGSAITLNGILIWLIVVEITDGIDSVGKYLSYKRPVISIALALYAGILLLAGIARKSSFLRKSSLLLFAVIIFKVFLVDTSNVSEVGRFTSFIILGAILLTAGFLYYRFKEKIREFIEAENPHEQQQLPQDNINQ